jgi:hypothetical protein
MFNCEAASEGVKQVWENVKLAARRLDIYTRCYDACTICICICISFFTPTYKGGETRDKSFLVTLFSVRSSLLIATVHQRSITRVIMESLRIRCFVHIDLKQCTHVALTSKL